MTTDANKPERAHDEQSLANLLRLAGERPEIPLSIESRVYHRVQQEWQASTKEPNAEKVYAVVHKSWKHSAGQSRLLRWLALAGVMASAILAFMLWSQPEPVAPPVVVATVAGIVTPTQSTTVYQEGAPVYGGDTLETGPGGGLSLLLSRNATLRVDENTRVRVDDSDRIALLSGRIYADTGEYIYRDNGLVIDTPFGTVRDIGTQFAISANPGSLDVAVREGRVEVSQESAAFTARMGERLTLGQGQSASVSTLDTHDEYWDWIVDLTPTYDTTNKSLLDFLKWAARETGRELRFESDESRMLTMRTDVHGSVEGLTPDEALEAILSTTMLDYRIDLDKVVLQQPTIQ
jgi:ferric-dicitrate binding protein FerR (iron transport regulator)